MAEEPTKAELAQEASALEIEGRSGMTKSDLADALAGEPQLSLDQVLGAINEMWRTISYGSVNDQPVKVPNEEELDKLSTLLAKATDLTTMAREK